MSQVYCWECEESYHSDEVFDIPVFSKGYTIKWCLNCAMKQLEWTDYRLVPKPEKYKKYKIKSIEDDVKEFNELLNELLLCYKKDFKQDITQIHWEEIMMIAQEVQYHSGEYENENTDNEG